jgi:transcriptional regulator NrdR family protein
MSGIPCPECGSVKHRVYATRTVARFVVRTRLCAHCGTKFRTFEQGVSISGRKHLGIGRLA